MQEPPAVAEEKLKPMSGVISRGPDVLSESSTNQEIGPAHSRVESEDSTPFTRLKRTSLCQGGRPLLSYLQTPRGMTACEASRKNQLSK